MVLYKDIFKGTDALFTRDWCHDNAWEVENNWKHSENKVDFKNKHTSNGSNYEKHSNVSEANFSNKKVDFNLKLDTSGKTVVDVAAKDVLTSGLKIGSKHERSSKGNKCELNVDFLTPDMKHPLHAFATIVPCCTTTRSLYTSALWKGCCNTDVGADLYVPCSLDSVKYSVGVSKLKNDVILGLKFDHAIQKANADSKMNVTGMVHAKNPVDKLEFAAMGTYAFNTQSKSAALVAKYSIDKNTWAKVKLTDDLKVSALLRNKCDKTKGECFLGLWVDPKSKNIADNVKVGAKVIFS